MFSLIMIHCSFKSRYQFKVINSMFGSKDLYKRDNFSTNSFFTLHDCFHLHSIGEASEN